MSNTPISPDNASARFPVLAKHWPDFEAEARLTFAREAAAAELGRSYSPPENSDFTDRPPPGAGAMARPVEHEPTDATSRLKAALHRKAA